MIQETFHFDGKLLIGGMYFDTRGSFFPAEHWNDRILMVLGFWLENLYTIKKSESATVYMNFINGPYALKTVCENETIVLNLVKDPRSSIEHSVYMEVMHMEKLCHMIYRTVNEVLDIVDQKGWGNVETDELRIAYYKVREAEIAEV